MRSCAREKGLTFIELVAVAALLMLVASAALPLGKNAVRRTKEIQLRRALQTMRDSIDEYHKYAQAGAIKAWDPDWEFYPKDLDMLIEGVEVTAPQNPTPKTVQYLREIPEDPMTKSTDWGMRSYQDEPDTDSWGGENLYDVYSLSTGIAMDGTAYSSW
jgi:general secretion pathway protein G